MWKKFIDIGANLCDPMYQGIYGGKQKHPADIHVVLKRAWTSGLERIILTVGSLSEVNQAVELAQSDERLFITIGCHPTRCNEFAIDPEKYYEELCRQIENNRDKVIAIGECGLDYDRLQFCEKDVQKTYFEKQLSLAEKYDLPLFLHCRNSFTDFFEIIVRNKDKVLPRCGVVHSFDGTLEEAKSAIDFGLHIGINGCSLKTEESLKVVKEIPTNYLLVETDAPWCGIRPSHAGYKFIKSKFNSTKKKEKWTEELLIDSRNEPCQLTQVVEVICGIKEEPMDKLVPTFFNNTMRLFFFKEKLL